ncbi:hypothetical protein R1flu_000453 [Riccia fluitans]|uniref:Uncharacterized protein n=1 Tax=Riccia fluitans TaxID=41844 RepID=A0ABD1Y0G5_9MARC
MLVCFAYGGEASSLLAKYLLHNFPTVEYEVMNPSFPTRSSHEVVPFPLDRGTCSNDKVCKSIIEGEDFANEGKGFANGGETFACGGETFAIGGDLFANGGEFPPPSAKYTLSSYAHRHRPLLELKLI